MKLEEYVRQTLLDITQGVATAQSQAPVHIAPGNVEAVVQLEPQMINFEIGITVMKEGAGGLKVFSVGELNAGASSETVNRISFAVPVYFQAPKTDHL